jgi:two-component system, chemotaxis family, CheB/CheR fusion protein
VGHLHTSIDAPNRREDVAGRPNAFDREQLRSLIAVTSHELRQPLHLMRLALVRFFPRGDEKAREVLERYIDRMARVVRDMSDLVQLEQGGLPLTLRRIDLAQLLRDVVDAYQPDAALHRIKLSVEGAASPASIEGDEQRLLQVLSNVLDNAIKFTPVDGSIQASLVRDDRSLYVRVRDSGHGISPEFIPRAFDLYASSTTSRGTGIGLAVARRIIELHRGSIHLLSEGTDRGTEVVIVLPVRE